jgi:hypothetical protein
MAGGDLSGAIHCRLQHLNNANSYRVVTFRGSRESILNWVDLIKLVLQMYSSLEDAFGQLRSMSKLARILLWHNHRSVMVSSFVPATIS